MSSQQLQHPYECLCRDIPFNPAQTDQFVQIEELELPDFLYHLDKDEDPVPCFAMTNPYEAILTHDLARTCVCIASDMLPSFQPQIDPSLESDQGIDIWYLRGSGKTHIHQMGLWSIMSDRPSYTIHLQPSDVSGSGCMDFCLDKLNHQVPLFVLPLAFKILGYHFEVYTLVSEIQDKMDLILGVKNIFELEGIINSRTCSVNFLKRSLPIFPSAHHKFKPSKMAYVKVRIPLLKSSLVLP